MALIYEIIHLYNPQVRLLASEIGKYNGIWVGNADVFLLFYNKQIKVYGPGRSTDKNIEFDL